MIWPPLEHVAVFVIDLLVRVKIRFYLLFHATSLLEFFEATYVARWIEV